MIELLCSLPFAVLLLVAFFIWVFKHEVPRLNAESKDAIWHDINILITAHSTYKKIGDDARAEEIGHQLKEKIAELNSLR